MLRDKLLKLKWRVFIILLYVVMVGAIILRLFPITESFRDVLNALQIWAAVCVVIFTFIYYKKPELVRNEEAK